jgi:hypothetical protein
LAVAGTLLLLGSAAGEARDFEKLLTGDYAFSGGSTCLSSPGGFNPDLSPVVPGPAPVIGSNSVSGVRTFNGDGTGKVSAVFHTIIHPFTIPGTFPAVVVGGGGSVSTLEGDFNYQVMPDLTVIITETSSTGTVLKGGTRVGWTISAAGVPRSVGRISEDLRTISLTQDDVEVEQIIFDSPEGIDPPVRLITPRICHRERILLELKNRK